ncbi:MAG: T9SS type A sorting domain-containing protein [bacterium]|nr:T9SS type A sorting domain-containing protein [bacterium]
MTNTNGARFVVYGYYDGSPQLGRIWGGSALYPVGTVASHSNYITFATGEVPVDQFVIRMFDPVSSDVLLEIFLPVDYFFGPHAVNEIQMSHTSPSWLINGAYLVVDFAYQTSEPGGVRISARPFSGGSLAPGYSASGVALSPVGNGTSSQSFTFAALESHVDEVRIRVSTADYSTVLLEFFVPVDLHWGPHGVSNITFDPPYPECLAHGQPVTVEFDYATSDPAGCHAWAIAANEDGQNMIGQTYASSPVLPASGHVVRSFDFLPGSGENEVPFVRFPISDHTNTEILFDVLVPVAYGFGPNAIRNLGFYPASPAVLDVGERVDVSFDYVTTEVAGCRVYNIPYTYEASTPAYGISGSLLYFGTGSGSSFFTVTAGEQLVTKIEMAMYEEDAATVIMSYFRPVNYTFGGVGGVTSAREAPFADGPVLGQNFPNPFNPQTRIPVYMVLPGHATLKVYDVRGHLVRMISDEVLAAGRHELFFDGSDLASGAYFYALETQQGRQTGRMVLVK